MDLDGNRGERALLCLHDTELPVTGKGLHLYSYNGSSPSHATRTPLKALHILQPKVLDCVNLCC